MWIVDSVYFSIALIVPSYFVLKYAFCRWLRYIDHKTADTTL